MAPTCLLFRGSTVVAYYGKITHTHRYKPLVNIATVVSY